MEVEVLLVGPDHLDDVDPFLGVFVALLVLALLHAEHIELALVPADDDVQPESPFADMVGGDHLLGRHDRIEQRRMHGAEHGDALARGQQAGRPGDRLERRALVVGVAAVALPASDRQHEVDAGLVRHAHELEIVRPASRPALRHQRHGAAGRTVCAEQPDLELVGVVHRPAVGLCGCVSERARLPPWSAEVRLPVPRAT